MGGFQLYERPDEPLLKREERGIEQYLINPGKFIRILEMKDVRQHKLETIIPCTTEEDLKDRGKSDWIAKAIVILQTSWFIVQCIARGFRHLPLTELEIVTLAYATMNSFIYVFWWDKPRDVNCPIRVYENVTASRRPSEWDSGFWGILERMMKYIIGDQDQYAILSEQRKVPIFWSSRYDFGQGVGPPRNDNGIQLALLGPSIIGMAFGAVHFIAWWYGFPSHAEFILWRVSCIALVAVPLLSAILSSLNVVPLDSTILDVIASLATLLLILSAWLYVVARIATIVIAFTALRSLPPDALLTVDWTTFIPHI
jgi:hypothetical protein